jgi:hypothetical protein
VGAAATIDMVKGCYLGQAVIGASVVKKPRGPTRTPYSLVFEDDVNIYDHESQGTVAKSTFSLEFLDRATHSLYVLGSNEEIAIGTLRSSAEPNGTGEPVTPGFALLRRADSILKRIRDGMDLQIPRSVIPR